MGNKPQLYRFQDIEHRLHTLEPGKTYIKPFVDQCGQRYDVRWPEFPESGFRAVETDLR